MLIFDHHSTDILLQDIWFQDIWSPDIEFGDIGAEDTSILDLFLNFDYSVFETVSDFALVVMNPNYRHLCHCCPHHHSHHRYSRECCWDEAAFYLVDIWAVALDTAGIYHQASLQDKQLMKEKKRRNMKNYRKILHIALRSLFKKHIIKYFKYSIKFSKSIN